MHQFDNWYSVHQDMHNKSDTCMMHMFRMNDVYASYYTNQFMIAAEFEEEANTYLP